MRQRLLFEGELSDQTIENVFPSLISKAVEADDDVFLRWNGATIRVEPNDTIDTLMEKYDKAIRLVGLANRSENPAAAPDRHLYRIRNRLAEFYIVARSFDEAADEMKKGSTRPTTDSPRTAPCQALTTWPCSISTTESSRSSTATQT